MEIALQPAEWTELPELEPPLLGEAARLHGRPPVPDELRLIVWPEALRVIDRHGGHDTRAELGGLLLGRVYRHEGHGFVEIEAALPVYSDEHGPVHFTFTADSWVRAHREREQQYPDLAIVGWFHTHPDLGIFFSADDEIVQSTAFTMPWQVALVFDPVRREAHFFGWQNGRGESDSRSNRIGPLAGFYEPAGESASSVDWTIIHSTGLAAMWQRGVSGWLPREGGGTASTIYLTERELALWRPLLLTGGVTLLAAALLFLALYWPLQRRFGEVEQLTAALLENERAANQAAGLIDCPSPALVMRPPGEAAAAGSEVPLFGRADDPLAARYRLEVRPISPHAGAAGPWQTIDTFRRPVTAGKIGTWSTAGQAAGSYELRLLAIRRGNAPDFQSACRVPLTLSGVPEQLLPGLPTPAATAAPAGGLPQGEREPDV